MDSGREDNDLRMPLAIEDIRQRGLSNKRSINPKNVNKNSMNLGTGEIVNDHRSAVMDNNLIFALAFGEVEGFICFG